MRVSHVLFAISGSSLVGNFGGRWRRRAWFGECHEIEQSLGMLIGSTFLSSLIRELDFTPSSFPSLDLTFSDFFPSSDFEINGAI